MGAYVRKNVVTVTDAVTTTTPRGYPDTSLPHKTAINKEPLECQVSSSLLILFNMPNCALNTNEQRVASL